MDEADTQPRLFTLPDRARIASALHGHGLGPVRLPGITTITPVCHGKQFGCTCPKHTKPKAAPPVAAQPWEPRPLKRAA